MARAAKKARAARGERRDASTRQRYERLLSAMSDRRLRSRALGY